MKAQKLGLVLGINIAAACLVLQGCKAKQGGKAVQPSPTERVTVISRPPAPAPRPAPAVVAPAPQVQPAQCGAGGASRTFAVMDHVASRTFSPK